MKETVVRLREVVRGGHVHVRVFVGTEVSLGLAGLLIFRADEWLLLDQMLLGESRIDRPDVDETRLAVMAGGRLP